LALDLYPLTREFVQAHPVDFEGRNHRRCLHNRAGQLSGGIARGRQSYAAHVKSCSYGASRVERVGGRAEHNFASVGFVEATQKLHQARDVTDSDQQDSRRVWVERAGVTNAFFAEVFAQLFDNVVASYARGFINYRQPVNCRWSAFGHARVAFVSYSATSS